MSKFIIYKLLTNLLTGNCFRSLLLFAFLSFGFLAMSQTDSTFLNDMETRYDIDTDTLLSNLLRNDTLLLLADTLSNDSLNIDSLIQRKTSSIDGKVEYPAKDSIRFDLKSKKVYLYNEANLTYGSLNLLGNYMEIDFSTNEIYSRGVEDSLGNINGSPIFKESENEFASEEMRYNFDSKKGLIMGVKTEESGGFLHGEIIKKMPDNTAYIKGGAFTTCDLDHPHYSFRFRRSKVIPGDKIITGPAYFEVGNVPTPLIVPFGLFPNQSGKQSGIIIPSYGESKKQGFYFMDGGYYWAVSDYMDLTFLGSVYTRGSWAINTKAKYKLRYKFSGNLDLKYAINILGSEGSPDYKESKDFKIYWTHSQDAKARPKSKFSANVNIRSSSFNQFELGNSFNDRLSNTFQSSINYSTRFGESWNMNVNLGHSQNTKNKTISLTVPQISLSGTRFYPFRKKDKTGTLKWYENISVNYSVVAKNQINVADSLLFTPGWEQYFQNGMKHTIPISSSVKVLKHLNWTNSVNLTSRWYSQYYQKSWKELSFLEYDTAIVVTDTVHGFVTANDFNFSSSFNTKIYGMFMFGENFPVNAIRHVLSPSVSFSYRPDFSESQWGYYDSYYNTDLEEEIEYSNFEGALYGSPGSGKQGSLNFSLSNNFEMKVRDRKDTITGTKKVILIDNLSLSTSYNMAKDSLRWSPFLISARTKLFKNLDIKYASVWDPYVLDSTGRKNLNQYEWDVNHRLFRMKDMNWTAGLSLNLSNKTFSKDKENDKGKPKQKGTNKKDKEELIKPGTIPWSLSLTYSLRYGMQHTYSNYILTKEDDIVQTLGFRGSVQLTPNWKFSFTSGYDFEANDLSYTQIQIHRDLHCWEMHFSWIPFGTWQSWNFSINIKSSMFKDLKVEKKKSHLDR